MADKENKISARLGADLTAQLESRGEKTSETLRRDLERYYAMLDRCRRELATLLSEPEQNLICDALNGVSNDTVFFGGVRIGVADSIRLNALDKKWKVDGPALDKKLARLSPGAELALIDAVEQFWRHHKERLF